MKSIVLIYCCLYLLVPEICQKLNKKKPNELGGLTPYVIGGVEVPITLYPHVALLTYKNMMCCGGSIISDRVILTAAHCFANIDIVMMTKDFEVYLAGEEQANLAVFLGIVSLLRQMHTVNVPKKKLWRLSREETRNGLLARVATASEIVTFCVQRGQRRQMTGRIVGGVEVPITLYPHVALIAFDINITLCGGSIISSRVVLSSAHCFAPSNKSVIEGHEWSVYLGSSKALQGTRYEVCKIIRHENYGREDLTFYAYDIAVMLLKAKIRFGPTIQKIKIAPNTLWRRELQYFSIAGFGMVENNVHESSPTLKATRMQYMNTGVCNRSHTDDGLFMPVYDYMFCMISSHWTSDCFGDSGSGVIWKSKYIVGLVTTGRSAHCGADTIPSMYIDVVYFKDWIRGKVKDLESKSVNSFCPKSNENDMVSKMGKAKKTSEDQKKLNRWTKPGGTKPPKKKPRRDKNKTKGKNKL